MVGETRCVRELAPAFVPGPRVLGPGWGAGPLLACPGAARTDHRKKKITRCPRGAEGIQQGGKDSLRRPGLELHDASLSHFARKHSSPGSTSHAVLLLTGLADFRWGSLKTEQARAVLTKLERKVELFLSLAKEPFSKTPPDGDKMASLSFLSGQ